MCTTATRARRSVINRALMAIADRLELPLVATNAVQYARRQDAQAAAVLEAMHLKRRTDDARGSSESDRWGGNCRLSPRRSPFARICRPPRLHNN